MLLAICKNVNVWINIQGSISCRACVAVQFPSESVVGAGHWGLHSTVLQEIYDDEPLFVGFGGLPLRYE